MGAQARTCSPRGAKAARPALSLAALLVLLPAVFLAWPAGAWAQEPGWCVQCHGLNTPPGRGLPLGQMAWQSPLAQDELSPCPGLRRARQELLASQARLAELSALLPGLARDRLAVAGLEQGLARAAAESRQALALPVTSLAEISQRLAPGQATLLEQVERPLRAQQEDRAGGAAWGLALMAFLALALAGLAGLRRLCALDGPWAGPALGGEEGAPDEAEAALPAASTPPEPLARVRRGELP